jgi:hypothetical protein
MQEDCVDTWMVQRRPMASGHVAAKRIATDPTQSSNIWASLSVDVLFVIAHHSCACVADLPTPWRYGGGRREAWPTHPSLAGAVPGAPRTYPRPLRRRCWIPHLLLCHVHTLSR